MKTRNTVSLAGVIAALVAAQLPAATPSHQCAQLWDDVLRLSCYDTAFGKPRPPAESPAPAASAASPASAAPAAAAAAGAAVIAAPAAEAAASTPAAAAPPVSTASAASAPAAAATSTAPAPKEKKGGDVVATATAVTQTLDGRIRVTLDNGQVWQQTEVESINPVRTDTEVPHQLFQVKVGDKITVKSGLLGARQMVAVDGRTARVTLLK